MTKELVIGNGLHELHDIVQVDFHGRQQMRVLVTGANGFIGRFTCEALSAAGHEVIAAVRDLNHTADIVNVTLAQIGDINVNTHWGDALYNVNVVVHLAARVHVMHDDPRNALDRFRAVNTLGTLALAEQALKAGVRRLIFVSTIKVNGEATKGKPLRADDPVRPDNPYAVSKHEAELGLLELGAHGLEVVIVRSPLVYGPGVKGNMRRLFALALHGIPVPFGAIHNRRDLIGVRNLADVLCRCTAHPAAPGQTFLVCDGKPISTPGMYKIIAHALGRKAHLIPIPPFVLGISGRLLGRAEEMQRLTESLEIDSEPTRTMLDWHPPVSFEEGIAETARWFLAQGSAR